MIGKERIAWIDAVKGFAIICVVLGHVVNGYMDAGLYSQHTAFLQDIYNMVYAFHMPLFFMISGFLFREAYVQGEIPQSRIRREPLNRQVLNLLLVYIIYSLLLGVSKMVFSGAVNNTVAGIDLLMIWARPIQLYWYLYVLLLFYVVFRIDKVRNVNPAIMLPVLAVLSACNAYIPTIPWFQVNRFLYYAFFFLLGICYRQITEKKVILRGGECLCIVSVVLSVVLWSRTQYLRSIPVANFIIAAGLTLGLLDLFRSVRFLSKIPVLNNCGKYCMEIYLLHTFFATAVRAVFAKTVANVYVSVLCNLIISTVIPIVFSVVVKKIGLYELFFKPNSLIRSKKRVT